MPTLVPQSVTFKAVTPECELLIEQAARCCYKSEGKTCPGSAAKMIQMIIKRGHESVLEHASATFMVTTDRGITHEIVRHRLASYSQESTRYVDYVVNEDVVEESALGGINIRVIPPIGMTVLQADIWWDAMKNAEKAYRDMRLSGCPPQVARDVLPTCLKADIWMTCNFREWRHFIKLRASKAAHPKMQIIAKEIFFQLNTIAPNVFPHEIVS